MRETVLQAELARAFRAAACWMAKWPDLPAKEIARHDTGGAIRFAVPKPYDLVGCRPPHGQLVAIEAKLWRARTVRLDDRVVRQVETLREIVRCGGWAALALNFRFESKRPPERVNRAFLLTRLDLALEAGAVFTLADAEVLAVELPRVTGGWQLPPALWPDRSPRT
jgi:hypothetical protein